MRLVGAGGCSLVILLDMKGKIKGKSCKDKEENSLKAMIWIRGEGEDLECYNSMWVIGKSTQEITW